MPWAPRYWSNSTGGNGERHTSCVCMWTHGMLFHLCVAWQFVRTYINPYLHQHENGEPVSPSAAVSKYGELVQKWGYMVWMQEGMHASLEQELQRSGEWAARGKTHLQRSLCVGMWWVAGWDGSPFKSRSDIDPQSSHFNGKRRRRKRNDECGMDQQSRQQPGTQPSTEAVGRVEKLDKQHSGWHKVQCWNTLVQRRRKSHAALQMTASQKTPA